MVFPLDAMAIFIFWYSLFGYEGSWFACSYQVSDAFLMLYVMSSGQCMLPAPARTVSNTLRVQIDGML